MGGAERLVALVGYSKALCWRHGQGARCRRGAANRLVDKVLPRPPLTSSGALSPSRWQPARGEIKRVMKGVPTTEAVAAFARLWVADEHWAAADKVMKRGK